MGGSPSQIRGTEEDLYLRKKTVTTEKADFDFREFDTWGRRRSNKRWSTGSSRLGEKDVDCLRLDTEKKTIQKRSSLPWRISECTVAARHIKEDAEDIITHSYPDEKNSILRLSLQTERDKVIFTDDEEIYRNYKHCDKFSKSYSIPVFYQMKNRQF